MSILLAGTISIISDNCRLASDAETLSVADQGRTQPGDIVILRNLIAPEKAHICTDAAQWLAERKIVLLGFDASVHTGHNKAENRETHDILMGTGICLLEVLANLDAISQPDVFFVAAPLKIKGLDSSPVRAFAIEFCDS